jgi:hypothetical protein
LRGKSRDGARRKYGVSFAENEQEVEQDDDSEWYRKEVGQEPEKGMCIVNFSSASNCYLFSTLRVNFQIYLPPRRVEVKIHFRVRRLNERKSRNKKRLVLRRPTKIPDSPLTKTIATKAFLTRNSPKEPTNGEPERSFHQDQIRSDKHLLNPKNRDLKELPKSEAKGEHVVSDVN